MANSANTTHKLFTSRLKVPASQYIGEHGRLFYHEDTGELRLSDGITPGGLTILTRSSGIIYDTTIVNSPTYTATANDYYIGVSYAGPVSITLPAATNGSNLIIKDEVGNCSINHITLLGTIDNDPAGVVLAINNGAIHLLYHNGWRII